MRQVHSFISVLLAATLAIPSLTAQIPLPLSDTAAPKAPALQVRLQASDAAALPVNSTSPNGYTVQVLDASGAPVVGAAVALRMPDDGPSGTFADGNKALVAYTDSKGLVRFPHIHWNGSPGTAMVRVTVVKGSAQAAAMIQQSLVANPSGTAVASAKPSTAPAASGTHVAPAQGPVVAASQGTVVAPFGPSTATSTQTPPPSQIPPANSSPATQTAAAAPAPPVPGTPVSPATPITKSGATAAVQSPSQTASSGSPNVSVTDTSSTGGTAAHAGISKKWILLAVLAAGAGVGAALAMSGHGSSPTAAAAGLTIGTPTLSVGH